MAFKKFRLSASAASVFLAALILDSSQGEQTAILLPPQSSIAAQVAASDSNDVIYRVQGLSIPVTGNQRGSQMQLDLHETSAFDADTTYSYGNEGGSLPVGTTSQHVLVTDGKTADGNLAIVSVNVDSGETTGVVQASHGGSPMTLHQEQGGSATITYAEEFTPPSWQCASERRMVHHETENTANGRRVLIDDNDIHDDHVHDNGHNHHLHGGNIIQAFEEIGRGLRGSKTQLGHRRLYQTDTYPQRYSFQVDMYLELDNAFVNQHEDLAAALAYVDVLVSGANIIYEHEIDTHLHVAHIAVTNHYDSAGSTLDALGIMKTIYGGSTWHYTDGNGIDLHHALLGNPLGGGIAYGGVLCNPTYGFGLSASLKGNFVSLDAATLWDMKVFAHELGHNFGSLHTHDPNGYNPVIDTCGSSCPSGLPLDESATLMSYCHQCSGGYSNIMYTFGGEWMGNDRSELNNWQNNADLQGTISYEPKRVSETMYSHVKTRGSCLDTTFPVPLQVCDVNDDCNDSLFCNGEETCDSVNGQCVPGTPPVCTDGDACTEDLCSGDSCSYPQVNCDDGNSCTIDTCDSIQGCQHELVDDCCGNGNCEASEDESNCQVDCGPFEIDTSPFCTSCHGRSGNMFDIEATADIELTSLTFRSYQGHGTVEVWTRPGSYVGHEDSSTGWTKVATKPFSGVGNFAFVETPDFVPAVTVAAGALQAFYVTHTDASLFLLFTDGYSVGSVLADDGRMKILSGRSVTYPFGYGYPRAWNGAFTYVLGEAEEPTDGVVPGKTSWPECVDTPLTVEDCVSLVEIESGIEDLNAVIKLPKTFGDPGYNLVHVKMDENDLVTATGITVTEWRGTGELGTRTIGDWDCTGMTGDACCAMIVSSVPDPDVDGNYLQCVTQYNVGTPQNPPQPPRTPPPPQMDRIIIHGDENGFVNKVPSLG